MPLNASFPLVLSLVDSAGLASNQKLADVPYDSALGKFNTDSTTLVDNNPHALVLPSPTTYKVYVKNLDNLQTLTVNWTPVGQAQDQAQVLAPGSFMLLWDVSGGGGGVTGVTLTAQVGPLTFESVLGG